MFVVGPGTPMPSTRVLEREVYVQFIYLTIYLSTASKGK